MHKYGVPSVTWLFLNYVTQNAVFHEKWDVLYRKINKQTWHFITRNTASALIFLHIMVMHLSSMSQNAFHPLNCHSYEISIAFTYICDQTTPFLVKIHFSTKCNTMHFIHKMLILWMECCLLMHKITFWFRISQNEKLTSHFY